MVKLTKKQRSAIIISLSILLVVAILVVGFVIYMTLPSNTIVSKNICSTDKDCYDGNTHSIDLCLNAGTTNSYCSKSCE